MIKIEIVETCNWRAAIRGMRNPLESWDKSDSREKCVCSDDGQLVDEPCGYDACCHGCYFEHRFIIGDNDLRLMQNLIKAGAPHRKFMRQIFISVDITAPLCWWKEFDQYKIGTVSDSCSTMHKLASTPITRDCFEMDDFEKYLETPLEDGENEEQWKFWSRELIPRLEALRQKYNETKDKRYWKELIRWLPEGWLQTRTWTANYSILRNIYHWRKNHKLTEWHSFCDWIKTLPYAYELITFDLAYMKNL